MGTIDTIIPDAMISSKPHERRKGTMPLVRKLLRAMAIWSEKRRSRAALRALTDDQLRDIGLTRREVHREVARSFFWD